MRNITKYLIIALALTLLPTLAQATITTATGTTQSALTDGIVWTYTVNPDGTATINQGNVGSATGAIISGDITLPDAVDGHTITGIAYYTWDDNGTPTNINDDVTNWKSVSAITLPATLTSIGNDVFSNALGLTSVSFENPAGWASLTHIGQTAFNFQNKNTQFVVDGLDLSGLTDKTMPNAMFRFCTGVTGTLTLPVGVQTIANSAFGGTSFTSVNFTDLTQLTYIDIYAFTENQRLAEVDLSQCGMLNTIANYAFAGDPGLTSLRLPANASLNIGIQAFRGDNLQGDLVIPSTSTTLANQVFTNNSSLRSITFTGTTLSMSGWQVFAGCNSLEYIDIPNAPAITGLTTLERGQGSGSPFEGTPAHTVIYLPTSTPANLITDLYNNMNYVLNGNCYWFYVQDGCDYYIPHAFTAASATWNAAGTGAETTANDARMSYPKLSTAYLPFDFMLDNTSELQGFTMLDKKNDPKHVFRFKEQPVTYTFKANTPYVLRTERHDGTAWGLTSVPNALVPATPVSKVQYAADGVTTSYDGGVRAVDNTTGGSISDPVAGTWGFYGTTEAVGNSTATSWRALILQSNKWWDLSVDTASPLAPQRAFLATSDGAVGARPSFELEDLDGNLIGEVTGIDGIDPGEPANSVETRVYNLNGQYLGKDVSSLPKGLYIVNGKKVIK